MIYLLLALLSEFIKVRQSKTRCIHAMISTGDQRDVPQYSDQPWLMTYVNARTISTANTTRSAAAAEHRMTSLITDWSRVYCDGARHTTLFTNVFQTHNN